MEIIATMGKSKEKVVFLVDENNHIAPKTPQDEKVVEYQRHYFGGIFRFS